MIYLDANATEPLRPEAHAAMLEAFEVVGNPASVHRAGRGARRILEDAREALAMLYGVKADGVVFVSGGTEANALAVYGLGAERATIIGATEHDAIRAAAPKAAILPVLPNGRADLVALEALLTERRGALVCLMLANNETGVIHPIAAAAELCHRFGAWLHVDAVQAAGRVPVSLEALGATSMAISSHKLGGPAGAGALLLAPYATVLPPLMGGGGQERGRRGGTPAVAIIAGFAAAALVARSSVAMPLADLRNQIEAVAAGEGAIICGSSAERLSNTTCLALPGVRADTQVMALDLEGIAVSAGAACSAGKIVKSHVLQAMGFGDMAGHAIRVSLPWNVQTSDISAFKGAYQKMARRLTNSCRSNVPSLTVRGFDKLNSDNNSFATLL